jgi:Fe-S-cluster containining protein
MGSVFYERGLRFECTRCSRCCRHSPGFVFLTREDIHRLRAGTGLSVKEFLDRYCRELNVNGFRRVSLIEKSNYDCIFWEEQGCTVYRYRPLQCRSFPFWSSNLDSIDSWEKLKISCPGVGRGRLYSKREIESWLARYEKRRIVASFAEMQ